MRLALSILIALLSAGPLWSQQQDTASGSKGRAIRVPQQLGPFRLARQERYDDPAHGTMFRYLSADSSLVDVFIYPGPDFDVHCPTECAAKALEGETTNFRSGFAMMRERGYVDSIEVAGEDTLVPDSTDAWRIGRALRLRVVRRGEVLRSDFVLWYLPTYRVKLRATYPDREPIRAYVRFFTDSVVAAIQSESRAAEEDRSVTISATLAGTPHEHLPTITAAMRSLGYVVADSVFAEEGALARTAPRADWTGSAMVDQFGGRTDSIRVVAVLSLAGDSTLVRISTEVTHTDSAEQKSTLAALRLAAAMELVSALTNPTPTPPEGPRPDPPASRAMPAAGSQPWRPS